MSLSLFCCRNKAKAYKNIRTDQDLKFADFLIFANDMQTSAVAQIDEDYVLQFKQQINFGPGLFTNVFSKHKFFLTKRYNFFFRSKPIPNKLNLVTLTFCTSRLTKKKQETGKLKIN